METERATEIKAVTVVSGNDTGIISSGKNLCTISHFYIIIYHITMCEKVYLIRKSFIFIQIYCPFKNNIALVGSVKNTYV